MRLFPVVCPPWSETSAGFFFQEDRVAFEEVKAFMTARGFADRLRILDGSSATVELAAQTLGCAPERIAKTVSLRLKTGPIVIVTAGDAKIDNRTYKHRFGEKAHLIAFDEVEALTGHAPGGVCPFALKPVFLKLSKQSPV